MNRRLNESSFFLKYVCLVNTEGATKVWLDEALHRGGMRDDKHL